MGKTTIQIDETTRDRLNAQKPSPGTSYDWVINWLLDKLDEQGIPVPTANEEG